MEKSSGRTLGVFLVLYITTSCFIAEIHAQHHWTSWWKPGGFTGKRYYNIVSESRSPWGRKPASASKRNFGNVESDRAELGPILIKLLAGYPEKMNEADNGDSAYAQVLADILSYRMMDQKKDEPDINAMLR
ncbi:uncharacterized protein LOC120336350 isoform X1 [Styela clava]|uniref:uncharacterized protein LOC120336350 isoform X1 n=1 Tax=Styela clava TaxID=7725 RepID=UPI00193A7AAB|nr:uncharacterized protein LOC120336350 isoform X1 [Styela clava]